MRFIGRHRQTQKRCIWWNNQKTI